MILDGRNGYKIPCEVSVPNDAKMIIIAMHGFCGDKESSCISELEKKALDDDIGLIKFDWPAHGESEALDEELTIDNCLSDLDAVVSYAKKTFPEARLVAFATSFGGYLTLLYNYRNSGVFEKIILRSPAINMYEVFSSGLLENEAIKELNENGEIEFGFERKIKIKKTFLDDLKNNNVNEIYKSTELPNVFIIHGTDDDLVPFMDSEEFAKEHNCKLFPVEGADHRYKKPGELDEVIKITAGILS